MAVAAAELAPEAIELVERAGEEARSFAYEIARQAGLTAEDNYQGWIPVLILLYKFVWPPVKTALLIEQQVAGVLEQLYTWLGGEGRSIDKGLSALGSDIKAGVEVEDTVIYDFFTGNW